MFPERVSNWLHCLATGQEKRRETKTSESWTQLDREKSRERRFHDSQRKGYFGERLTDSVSYSYLLKLLYTTCAQLEEMVNLSRLFTASQQRREIKLSISEKWHYGDLSNHQLLVVNLPYLLHSPPNECPPRGEGYHVMKGKCDICILSLLFGRYLVMPFS